MTIGNWWNDVDRKNRSIRGKPCSGAIRYPTNSTKTGMGLNTCLRANIPVIGLLGLHGCEDEAEGTTILQNPWELLTSTIQLYTLQS
jgi:hypothetical protein